MTRSPRLLRALIGVFALTLLAAACGDSAADQADSPTSSTQAAAETTTSTTVAEAVTATDGSAPTHSHHDPIEVAEGTPVPTLSIEVLPDPKSGYNLRLDTTNFTFAPEHVSTDPVPGEGHAHLYIDGEKITRLYGPWYNMPEMAPGTHEIRVELSNNNHAPVAHNGQIIEAMATVEVPGEDAGSTATAEPVQADFEIAVEFADGEVVGGVSRQTIDLGSTVRLTIISDVADEAHLHVYDEMVDLEPGVPADLVFEADIPGVIEVELEGLGKPLVEFEIR